MPKIKEYQRYPRAFAGSAVSMVWITMEKMLMAIMYKQKLVNRLTK